MFCCVSGLELDLFINQKEYVSIMSQEAGVKVLLTDQGKIPFPATHGFTVSPGLSTSVGVRKVDYSFYCVSFYGTDRIVTVSVSCLDRVSTIL